MSPALLLNSSYEPVQIINWQKALILWLLDKVDVLEFHDNFARSASHRLQLPSVMRLKRYIRRPHGHSLKFNRENLYLRDRNTCQYCQKVYARRELTLDHVIPVSRGGENSWENLVAACRPCNQKKGNLTPSEARMPLLKKPIRPPHLPQISLDWDNDHPDHWKLYLIA